MSGNGIDLAGPIYLMVQLVSGCAESAERILLESYSEWGSAGGTAQEWMDAAALAAIACCECNSPAALALPVELQRVSRLPGLLRPSFVLRYLLRWDEERCSRLLQLSPDQIRRRAAMAALKLAEAELAGALSTGQEFSAQGASAYLGQASDYLLERF
jgi:hypothetical protein